MESIGSDTKTLSVQSPSLADCITQLNLISSQLSKVTQILDHYLPLLEQLEACQDLSDDEPDHWEESKEDSHW